MAVLQTWGHRAYQILSLLRCLTIEFSKFKGISLLSLVPFPIVPDLSVVNGPKKRSIISCMRLNLLFLETIVALAGLYRVSQGT